MSPISATSHVLLELRGPQGGDLGGIVLGLDDARAIAEALTQVADGARAEPPLPTAPTGLSAPDAGLLAASPDPERTLIAFARLAIPVFADWCTIDIAEGGGQPRRVAVLHADTSKRKAASTLARYPHDPTLRHPRSAVWRTGQADLAPEVPEERLTAAARSREHLAVLRALGCSSSIAAPLTTAGRVFGVMTFALAESRRWYRETDLPVAVTLAGCAAIAAENARLYRQAQATLRSSAGTSPARSGPRATSPRHRPAS